MSIYELEEITQPYLTEIKRKLVELGYTGTFTFDFESEEKGHFSSQYLLHNQVEEFPQ